MQMGAKLVPARAAGHIFVNTIRYWSLVNFATSACCSNFIKLAVFLVHLQLALQVMAVLARQKCNFIAGKGEWGSGE